MYCRFLPFASLILGCFFSTRAVLAQSPTTKPQAPQLRILAAGRQTVGEARGFSLTVEVSNPGDQALRYVGYRSDSFHPPLQKGQMMPLYQVELKQAGKWQKHPIGYCGWGVDNIELAAKTSAAFGVRALAGPWEAVRIGLPWHPFGDKEDAAPTIAWSPELTKQETAKLEMEAAELNVKAAEINVARANLVVERAERALKAGETKASSKKAAEGKARKKSATAPSVPIGPISEAKAREVAMAFVEKAKQDWGQPTEITKQGDEYLVSFKTPETEMQVLGPRAILVKASTGKCYFTVRE
ncbi:MAG: hypothetical protein ABSG53_08985 [Thermoguttaceae bacterium]